MRPSNARRSIFAFVFASLTACTSPSVGVAPSAPSFFAAEWIKQQIAEFDAGTAPDTNRVAGKVVFDGAPLYLIDSPCCDFYNYLYTADGKAFCAPSGGFAGGGDRKCPAGIGPLRRRSDN
ncbi:MAG: hypothetical protein ABI640_16380 [Gammaproteobacteria bacterium]